MTFEEIKNILSTKTVGIAGCGGLGSNCAVALARCGIGKLIIVDFDVIVQSNLNRQYYFFDQIGEKKVIALKNNLERINPAVEVIALDIVIDEQNSSSLFENCHVVVEAFDIAQMKQMLVETFLTELPQIPLVCGSGMAGWGNNDGIHVRSLGNLYICGDEKTEIAENCPPIAPRVGIVANMQANVVLEILLSKKSFI